MRRLLFLFCMLPSVFSFSQDRENLLIRQLTKKMTYTAKKECSTCEYVLFQVNYIEANSLDKPVYNRLIKSNKFLLDFAQATGKVYDKDNIESLSNGRFSDVQSFNEGRNSSVVKLKSKTANSQQEHATIYYRGATTESPLLEKIVLSMVNMRSTLESNYLVFHFY